MKKRVAALTLGAAVLGCENASTLVAPEVPAAQQAVEAPTLVFADPLVQAVLAELGEEGLALSAMSRTDQAKSALGLLRADGRDAQADFERAIAVQVLELVVEADERGT